MIKKEIMTFSKEIKKEYCDLCEKSMEGFLSVLEENFTPLQVHSDCIKKLIEDNKGIYKTNNS